MGALFCEFERLVARNLHTVVKKEYKSQRSPPQPVNPPKAKKPRLSALDRQEIFKEHLQKLKAKLPVANNNLPDIPDKQIFTRDMTKKIVEQRTVFHDIFKVMLTNFKLSETLPETLCKYRKSYCSKSSHYQRCS